MTGTTLTTESMVRARKDLLQYLRREPDKLIMVGHVSNWLRGGFSLRRTEQLLEGLVDEGIIRPASEAELKIEDKLHGYYLAEGALEKLPPEDRSYGIL